MCDVFRPDRTDRYGVCVTFSDEKELTGMVMFSDQKELTGMVYMMFLDLKELGCDMFRPERTRRYGMYVFRPERTDRYGVLCV